MAGSHFVWDPIEDNIVRELDEDGAAIANYTTESTHFGGVISQRRGNQSRFFHYDGQGSTLAVTDDSQNVTDTRRYSAFGQTTASSGSTVFPFQYIGNRGYYTDAVMGEQLVRRRTYKSQNGRWLSVDPLFQLNVRIPAIGVNPYLYVFNNAVIASDPSGLVPEPRMDECAVDPCEGKYKEIKVCVFLWAEPRMKMEDLKLDKVNDIWKTCCIKFVTHEIPIPSEYARPLLLEGGFFVQGMQPDPLSVYDRSLRCDLGDGGACRIVIHVLDNVVLKGSREGGFFFKNGRTECGHIVFDPAKITGMQPIELILAHELGHSCLDHCDEKPEDPPPNFTPCEADNLMHSSAIGTKLTDSQCKSCNPKLRTE